MSKQTMKEYKAEYYQANKQKIKERASKRYKEKKEEIDEGRRQFYKTKYGLSTRMYAHMRAASRKRGHPDPDFTLQEYRDWLFSQPNFDHLFNVWVESDYKKNYTPSPDRLDDTTGYSISNIQLVTWDYNRKKGAVSRRKKVNQLRNGIIINSFESIGSAAKAVNAANSSISCALKGKTKSSAGFQWEYAVD